MKIIHDWVKDPEHGTISLLSEIKLAAEIKGPDRGFDPLQHDTFIRSNLTNLYDLIFHEVRVPLAYAQSHLKSIADSCEDQCPDVAEALRRVSANLRSALYLTRPSLHEGRD